MKTVHCVRHGESTDNAAGVHQSPDSTLTQLGGAQAERVAERAAGLDFDALISSPYPRAKTTAEKIAQITGKNLEFSELLIERKKPASIEGKSYGDPGAEAAFVKWRDQFYVPGSKEDGENFETHLARGDAALAYLAVRPEERLVVVTHGILLRTMVGRILLGDQLTPEAHESFEAHATMANTGITTLQFFEDENRWNLWTYNDLAHLAD